MNKSRVIKNSIMIFVAVISLVMFILTVFHSTAQRNLDPMDKMNPELKEPNNMMPGGMGENGDIPTLPNEPMDEEFSGEIVEGDFGENFDGMMDEFRRDDMNFSNEETGHILFASLWIFIFSFCLMWMIFSKFNKINPFRNDNQKLINE